MELVDRFGLLPGLTAQLLTLARLRLMARSLGIARLDLDREAGVLDLGHGAMGHEAALERLQQRQPDVYARAGDTRLAITLDLAEPQDVVVRRRNCSCAWVHGARRSISGRPLQPTAWCTRRGSVR